MEQAKLDKWSERNLTLDLTRGKPNQAQLDLSSEMLSIISDRGDCFSASGLDCRIMYHGHPDTMAKIQRMLKEEDFKPNQAVFVLEGILLP